MTFLWPRLDTGTADDIFEELSFDVRPDSPVSVEQHRKAYFAAVGTPVPTKDLKTTRQRILEIATEYGFPDEQPTDINEQFDLAMTRISHELFPMGWAEAASVEVWSHIALCLVPDVTWWRWRFRKSQSQRLNRERFVGSDLTRHSWARTWWRFVQVEEDLSILELFGEAGLNQILERRNSLGSSQALISSVAEALRPHADGAKRAPRDLVRDVTSRALRQMAFIDDSALDRDDRRTWAEGLVATSIRAMEHTEL